MTFYATGKHLYVACFNKWYKVLAVFTNTEDANDYMDKYVTASVLKIDGNAIALVDKNDKGVLEVRQTL